MLQFKLSVPWYFLCTVLHFVLDDTFEFRIILCTSHDSLCPILPSVLRARISYNLLYIRLAKKLPQENRFLNILKHFLLNE